MKLKYGLGILLLAALTVTGVLLGQGGLRTRRHYVIAIQDEDGTNYSGGAFTVTVYDAGMSDITSTCYTTPGGTTGFDYTNLTDAQFDFWHAAASISVKIVDDDTGEAVTAYDLTVTDHSIILPKRQGRVLTGGVTADHGVRTTFDTPPVFSILAGTAATGATTTTTCMLTPDGYFELYTVGTTTIPMPQVVATGLDVSRDDENNESVEVCGGILANSKQAFTVGTDPAFYFKAEITLSDVSGTDAVYAGFRLQEAYQALPTGYDTFASLAIMASANPAVIYTCEELDGGTHDADDSGDTWADGATKVLEVQVSAAGVVTYKLNGAALTTPDTDAFTITDGDVVVPFVHCRGDTAGSVTYVINSWECGYQ